VLVTLADILSVYMEEKLDRIEKNMGDLIEIVVSIKDNMVTRDELASELVGVRAEIASVREELGGKIDGVQRSVDAGFERHSALEARVSKIETELHM